MSEPQQTPPAQGNGRSKGRRRGLVGPVILIAIGIIFLLQNLDLLPWDVWTVIWRGWPAILILVGLDMLIGRRSGWGTFIVLVLAALLIWAVISGAGRGGGGTTTIPFAQKLEGATSAEVRIASGIASLRIEASDDRDALAEGTIQETSLHPVTRSFQKSGETAGRVGQEVKEGSRKVGDVVSETAGNVKTEVQRGNPLPAPTPTRPDGPKKPINY